ncbi:MAG: ThiF family adenylyltransferase [Acidobacteria bacterium]|nr:ThiF family adenylyltransferase [Acidobacteriota bacterium]
MSTGLLDFQTDRDAALKLIDWFDIDRVRAARILVVGAGAIGNEVLKNLALLGIGNVFVYDRDTIEMSNLSRSVLFRSSDAGALKAAVAARRMIELNPSVSARWQAGDVTLDLGLGVFRTMDVIIGCLDNREARLHVNRVCWKLDRPWVDAGIGQLNGQVRAYRPGNGACYECAMTESDYRRISVPCGAIASRYASEGKVPTTPTIASIVAGVQVQEALKLLSPEVWTGRMISGREFVFNGTSCAAAFVDLPVREDCPAHDTLSPESILELPKASATVTTCGELLAAARSELGEGAVVDLNFELAVDLRCPGCQSVQRLLRPFRKVYREDLECEKCGRQGYVVTTHTIGGTAEDYEEDFLGLPLAAIGVPRFDILTARGDGGMEVSFELSGDGSGDLGWNGGTETMEDQEAANART